jgi:hypothetical protein
VLMQLSNGFMAVRCAMQMRLRITVIALIAL